MYADTKSVPEVHFIGEIEGCTGFGKGVSCKWFIDHGEGWDWIEGELGGQTHFDYPQEDDNAVWCHPLDAHFAHRSVQGWPRLLLQVWKLDRFGRMDQVGNGFVHMPTSSGCFELECSCWRPTGTVNEEIAGFFLGGLMRLNTDEVLFNTAWTDRNRIVTVPAGRVQVRIEVMLTHASHQNLEWG